MPCLYDGSQLKNSEEWWYHIGFKLISLRGEHIPPFTPVKKKKFYSPSGQAYTWGHLGGACRVPPAYKVWHFS